MLDVAGVVVVVVVGLWAVAVLWLRGETLRGLDQPTGERFAHGDAPGPELQAVLARMSDLSSTLKAVPMRERNAVLRKIMDEMFADRVLDARFVPVDAGGVSAEWVLAPGADPARRLLYIHGGAFVMGSPKSHRTLTSRLSALTGGAVLAIDYRLMPEHPRQAGIDDCRAAYRWLLDHGPDGLLPASALFVAGDSAGGNLTLSLIQWVRDAGLRAPDAAVALSPLTDATLASPSLRANLHSDAMLGPLFGPMARVPQWLLLWIGLLQTRIRPCDPRVSPLFARDEAVAATPPALVITAEFDPLRDEGDAYAEALAAAGVPTRHIQARGHTHLSPTMVDLVVSGAAVRAEMAEALRGFLSD